MYVYVKYENKFKSNQIIISSRNESSTVVFIIVLKLKLHPLALLNVFFDKISFPSHYGTVQ